MSLYSKFMIPGIKLQENGTIWLENDQQTKMLFRHLSTEYSIQHSTCRRYITIIVECDRRYYYKWQCTKQRSKCYLITNVKCRRDVRTDDNDDTVTCNPRRSNSVETSQSDREIFVWTQNSWILASRQSTTVDATHFPVAVWESEQDGCCEAISYVRARERWSVCVSVV